MPNRFSQFIRLATPVSLAMMFVYTFGWAFYICGETSYTATEPSFAMKSLYGGMGTMTFVIFWTVFFVPLAVPIYLVGRKRAWYQDAMLAAMLLCEFPAAICFRANWSAL